MNLQEINEIMSCLLTDTSQTCYYHYQDSYIHLLVNRWLQQFNDAPYHQEMKRVATVADFKASKYARWQHRPMIKQWLASHAGRNAVLQPLPHIALLTDAGYNPMGYALTLGKWGNEKQSYYYQTSRAGFNLVLQLNLPLQILRAYEAMKINNPAEACQNTNHPVNNRRLTLAWARLDIDLANNQVLIEEIQSDWITELQWGLEDAKDPYCYECGKYNCRKHRGVFTYYGSEIRCEHFIDAMEGYYKEYKNRWSTMMLTATLEFIWQELGHDMQVFYHQFGFGNQLKRCSPPRSIYKALPEKFGFKITNEYPVMLLQDRQMQKKLKTIKKQPKQVDMRFYRLV